MKENTKQQLQASFKSQDTEEWLDIYFTRPIGLWWANFFNRFDCHPNVITIFSIFLGIGAGVMFYFTDFISNLIGVLLLMWANFYDSADGQLARMTGKKTHWGRILDGFAGDLWFYTIYISLCLRLMPQVIPFTHMEWSFWIFIVAVLSGLVCHTKQCQLADYYRNIHLFFLKGEKESELDTSAQQRTLRNNTPKKGNFWWRAFLYGYTNYTRAQEKMTPQFQLLIQYIKNVRKGKIPDAFRSDFRTKSLPLIKFTNILTFNCRAIVLYIGCLLNIPWIYFITELTFFTFLAIYMHYKHEKLCSEMQRRLETDFYNKEKEQ
ncbi:MAG: CDP-alcohol phosphatidyltransferase family protein [Bacteroidaceae bacterium]